ncbi:transposase family protein [Streptomyces capitiformicae]|uniref:DDE Tnp4 domain-containing protein n=1 Tax=Streptomyces capitiformicae TaxID=2014920 RepID=A0A918Z9F9_9ACTN|nr:transposase family protein [Streptomyces capitiformicae]GHE41682.1 hypothetical protein GCM10017771_61040 [Streptomyces capitiformicae]
MLLDGTLVRTRRRTGADNRKNFSGKHKAHGLLFLALTDEKGNLIWISAAKPGRSSEITTARHNKIIRHLREAGLGALADLGFVGLDDDPDDPVIITGRKATRNHRLTGAEKEANRLLNRERTAVEHGFANLKSWRFLTKIRMNARHATILLRALLVLAKHRSPQVTDDLPKKITCLTGASKSPQPHTSSVTSGIRMKTSQWARPVPPTAQTESEAQHPCNSSPAPHGN